jgi:apolipoprotein D and lipocalin family protein
MKLICALLLFLYTGIPNKPLTKVDPNRFGGKWYSLYSIPTFFDKGSQETTTNYTYNADGYYNVVTTYKKANDPEVHSVKSKLFPVQNGNSAQMKAQFIWPYKVDYWVVDLADDYSYAVVGHPDHKFLFIMSRKPFMDPKLYDSIVAKCKAMGYETDKLTCQNHKEVSIASKK